MTIGKGIFLPEAFYPTTRYFRYKIFTKKYRISTSIHFYDIENMNSLELFILLWLLYAPDIDILTEVYERKMETEKLRIASFRMAKMDFGIL